MLYLGIDLGTSAVKLLLMDGSGAIKHTVSEEYSIYFPKPGWSEQNPEDWWNAVKRGVKRLTEGDGAGQIAGISFGGQMHGLVILDQNDGVIRPAILWNDGRTKAETDYLNETVGKKRLSELTGNIAFAGFTAPKLLWLRKQEPENFAHIRRIMLPKDYIAYKLTGVHSTDYSDASGTLLLDVAHKRWSEEMLAVCGITREQLPTLYESYEETGRVLPLVAAELGLKPDCRVAAGAGDNAAAAVGTGTVGDGRMNLSLGTSGTLFMSGGSFRVDAHHALHSFAHADGRYHLMGCMLSAASCNRWWVEEILHSGDFGEEQGQMGALGENHVYFLPYLMGERSPHNDPDARGTFTGLTMDTTRGQMTQAVLEGVAFALRDSLEVARALGVTTERTAICGGGAKSPVWKRMIANIFNMKVDVIEAEEGPALGAAILAAVCCGESESVEAAAERIVQVIETVEPEPELAARYEAQYRRFAKLYPALQTVFSEIAE